MTVGFKEGTAEAHTLRSFLTNARDRGGYALPMRELNLVSVVYLFSLNA